MNHFTIKPRFIDSEDTPPSFFDSILISINLNIADDVFVSTHTRPCLFDCGDFTRHFTRWTRIEVEHDNTWDDFGRAYFENHDYQFTEFHCTLCSVDEIRRQIEAWVQQYELNRSEFAPCLVREVHESQLLDLYFAENHWDEGLCAWIEDFRTRNSISKYYWAADGHSCRPYHDSIIFLHQLVHPSLCGRLPQSRAASRLRCRSSLMASCHQDAGDDLLGH